MSLGGLLVFFLRARGKEKGHSAEPEDVALKWAMRAIFQGVCVFGCGCALCATASYSINRSRPAHPRRARTTSIWPAAFALQLVSSACLDRSAIDGSTLN